jgi:hypothetical protein
MKSVKFTVGGAFEDEASRRFVDAWHRAERGEVFHQRYLAFESWDALARVLTGKRMELLRYVRRNNVGGWRTLEFPPMRVPHPFTGRRSPPRRMKGWDSATLDRPSSVPRKPERERASGAPLKSHQ